MQADFAAMEYSRNAITGQFLVKECRRICCVTANGMACRIRSSLKGIELGENGSIFPRPKGKPR